ncbi:transcriptional repressor MprA|nr:transcriptional repressor MprA [Candidatus Pantoea persica]
MESSFTPIEQMLNICANCHKYFPLHEIILTRFWQGKLLENRNQDVKGVGN